MSDETTEIGSTVASDEFYNLMPSVRGAILRAENKAQAADGPTGQTHKYMGPVALEDALRLAWLTCERESHSRSPSPTEVEALREVADLADAIANRRGCRVGDEPHDGEWVSVPVWAPHLSSLMNALSRLTPNGQGEGDQPNE